MDEQKAFKEAELSDGEVRGHDSLKTFLTGNSHSDVRGPGGRSQREWASEIPNRHADEFHDLNDRGLTFVTYHMTN